MSPLAYSFFIECTLFFTLFNALNVKCFIYVYIFIIFTNLNTCFWYKTYFIYLKIYFLNLEKFIFSIWILYRQNRKFKFIKVDSRVEERNDYMLLSLPKKI